MHRIRIGTRPSKLAVIQAEMVAQKLSERGIGSQIIKILSSGDVDTSSPLYSMSSVGVFTQEVNAGVLNGEVDVAVHSAKDLPSVLPDGLEIAGVLPRENFLDALVSKHDLLSLPKGAKIGTSSIRRIHELSHMRKDLRIENIRGNLDTRLRKYQEGEYDGIIVAEAGLHRLSANIQYHLLSEDDFLPAPNQGIIAIVGQTGSESARVIRDISHEDTFNIMRMERKLITKLNLGCSLPAGILCRKTEFGYRIRCRFYSTASREFKEFTRSFTDESELSDMANEIVNKVPLSYGYAFKKG